MKLVFVYNAGSGKVSALQDTLHKIISPSTYNCRLCQITHSIFNEKKEWRTFLDLLDLDSDFLHKDEFLEAYPALSKTQLPVVFLENSGNMSELITSAEFKNIESVEDLSSTLSERKLKQAKCLISVNSGISKIYKYLAAGK